MTRSTATLTADGFTPQLRLQLPRDGEAAARAERLGRHAEAHRRLATLVLVPLDERDRLLDRLLRVARGDDLLRGLAVLDVELEDRVEDVVLGQVVRVALVVAELGAGRPADRVR